MRRLVIAGRPNVGKSTLFNRLVGARLALVDDQPGVTRDRREGEARLEDLHFTVIDTAGLDEARGDSLAGRIQAQTEAALAGADAILFVIDARAGVTPLDAALAARLRRARVPVVLAANKCEGRAGVPGLGEAYALGLGEPLALSAEHGEGLDALADRLRDLGFAPEEGADDPEDGTTDEAAEGRPARPLRLAVIGRPNAGKSTLINALLGEERLLTSPEAGTTRDAIEVPFRWHDREMLVFDTAGMRKRARVQDKLEKLAVGDALRAIRFADVCVVAIDATQPFEAQDLAIASLVEREGRALVFAVTKWDLVEHPPETRKALREAADRLLPQVRGAALVMVSGLRRSGLDRLMQAVLDAERLWNTRVSTGQVNRFLEEALARNPPPAVRGRRIKIRYMTQAKARPPTFALFGNQLDALPESYQRYLVNLLREAFGLPGVPIRLSLRTVKNPYAQD